ncbi:hypothetical protein BJY52DRAFT_1229254 [Lactarius psammicola]|nr:hypothetical protein BJY52DRAFT_1229254 [Lactarius psammicola]
MLVHVSWTGDPIPPFPAVDPNDTAHLLAHITTFQKDPVLLQPYNQIMDAGFDPNTQVVLQSTSLGAQEGRANYKWLLSSQDLPPGSAECQGSTPNRHHHLPPIETLPPLPAASFDSLQSSVQYTQPSVQEVAAGESPVRAGLSDLTKRYIREASANLHAICATKTPNSLPQETRCIIRDAVEMQLHQLTPHPRSPQYGCMSREKLTRQASRKIFENSSRRSCIQDFIESINDALCAPVLTELRNPMENPGWEDTDGEIERIKSELMVELRRDVSESQTGYAHYYLTAPLQLHRDNDFPASVEGFNLSVALVIAALDSGVEENRGDLEQAGLIPSSWFHLASAILGALMRGALRSEGCKIQGRVWISDDDDDDWRVTEGLTPPVMQGGRIAAQAQQLTNFFMHYAGTDEPPLMEFYDSVMWIGQNHIEKVVRLKAAATYQVSTSDVRGLTDMVLDDMSCQLYSHMTTDNAARHTANQHTLDWLFVEAQHQLGPFMTEWKALYKHHLIQALKDNEEDQEEAPPVLNPLLQENEGYIKLFTYNRSKEIRESIARTVTDPILDGDEISRARERIWLDHAEEIEEVKTKGKGPRPAHNGAQSRSSSVSSFSTPHSPDQKDVDMVEPQAPLFFTSSYPEMAKALETVINQPTPGLQAISNISVPTDVRASQAPGAPVTPALEQEPAEAPSRVLTPDSTRGVASSMHNPENQMVEDPPPPSGGMVPPPIPTLPQLSAIPLLLGLAKMLNALQANLMTSFTAQVNALSARIDAQDEVIKINPPAKKTKGKTVAHADQCAPPISTPNPIPTAGASDAAPAKSQHTSNNEVLPVPDPLLVPCPPPLPP